MGYEEVDTSNGIPSCAFRKAATAPTWSTSRRCPARLADLGAGSVHHVAFAVENRAKQLEVRKALIDTGYQVTPVIDRDYFWSIYFRTPGGVLFEIATNEPGFDRDEDTAHLGEALKLPKQHAHLRAYLESTSSRWSMTMSTEAYIRGAPGLPGGPLLFVFHGTGGDEHQLVSLRARDCAGATIISPRGDVSETAPRGSSVAPARASTTWTTLPARPRR
jgi:hypothetical protein